MLQTILPFQRSSPIPTYYKNNDTDISDNDQQISTNK